MTTVFRSTGTSITSSLLQGPQTHTHHTMHWHAATAHSSDDKSNYDTLVDNLYQILITTWLVTVTVKTTITTN